MASIQKRGKKYAVVYTYDDSKGEKKQKWETFITKKEALKRKAAVEMRSITALLFRPVN